MVTNTISLRVPSIAIQPLVSDVGASGSLLYSSGYNEDFNETKSSI